MAGYPGFYAVPGSMFPGEIWPGNAALPPIGPSADFTLGTPYFRWETGDPYFRWTSGTPYFRWAAGDPYLS